jgi:hypothetical protein
MELRQLVNELKTRDVYRTAAAYCAGAWVLLQVADVMFPMIGLQDWAVTVVLVMAAVGFPIAILLSWIFDLIAQEPVETTSRPSKTTSDLPLAHVIELTLILLLATLVGYLYFCRLPGPPKQEAEVKLQPASIAVLPFVNLSGVANRKYVGDGLAALLTRPRIAGLLDPTQSSYAPARFSWPASSLV